MEFLWGIYLIYLIFFGFDSDVQRLLLGVLVSVASVGVVVVSCCVLYVLQVRYWAGGACSSLHNTSPKRQAAGSGTVLTRSHLCVCVVT